VLVDSGSRLALPGAAQIYELNTPLFSDYAAKLRTIHLPAGANMVYESYDAFELPVGSVIAKTFFYFVDSTGRIDLDRTGAWDGNPHTLLRTNIHPIETRLLVKQAHGWDALPYVWDGHDAVLSITGDLQTFTTTAGQNLNYIVPSRNQCASCHATNHTTGALQPIGIKARHLNHNSPVHGENQLVHWQQTGLLAGLPPIDEVPENADFYAQGEGNDTLDHRARSYLDINCGHCHNPAGAADTSGLLLDYQDHSLASLGFCKAPIASGRGSGGRMFSIVPGDTDASIMSFRMNTTDPATMMPELGRTLVHAEGVALISAWINQLSEHYPPGCR
jgi:uncharacterized repeat protein (TIGR03806 family)